MRAAAATAAVDAARRTYAAFTKSDRTLAVGLLPYSPYAPAAHSLPANWPGLPAARHFGIMPSLSTKGVSSTPTQQVKEKAGTLAGDLLCVELPKYSAPIPAVLLALSAALREEGGLATAGIFRHPRDQKACELYVKS